MSGEPVLTCPRAPGALETPRAPGRLLPSVSAAAPPSLASRHTPPRDVCMEPHVPGLAQWCGGWGLAVATVQLQTAVPRASAGFCLCFVSAREMPAPVWGFRSPGVNMQNLLFLWVGETLPHKRLLHGYLQCTGTADLGATYVHVCPHISWDMTWSHKATGPGPWTS